MKLLEKLQTIRVELQGKKLKKSGKNKFANFDYYQLEDIVPSINELCLKYKTATMFNVENEQVSLTITDVENGESVKFVMPFEKPEIKGANSVQNLGGSVTYLRRYLFITAFEITEGDEFDATIGKSKDLELNILDAVEDCKTEDELTTLYKKYNGKTNNQEQFLNALGKRKQELKK
jgi:hypothetical protein